jgi:hypothetical protein
MPNAPPLDTAVQHRFQHEIDRSIEEAQLAA